MFYTKARMLYTGPDSQPLAEGSSHLRTNVDRSTLANDQSLNFPAGSVSQTIIDVEIIRAQRQSISGPYLTTTPYGQLLIIGSLAISSFNDSPSLMVKLGDSVPFNLLPRRSLRSFLIPCVEISEKVMANITAAGIQEADLVKGLSLLGLSLRVLK